MECKYEGEIKGLRDDVKDIKSDVKSLLKFNWRLGGVGIAVGILVGFVSFASAIIAIAGGLEKWLH